MLTLEQLLLHNKNSVIRAPANMNSISWVTDILNSFSSISLIYHSSCIQDEDGSNPKPCIQILPKLSSVPHLDSI